MNQTPTVMLPDLDKLADRIERAAGIVQQLRSDRDRLQQERDDLARRLKDLEDRLGGQDAGQLVSETQSLRREQRDWQIERREVTNRVESLLKKLERIEE